MAETTIKADESKNSPIADTGCPSSDGAELSFKTTRWHKRKGKLLLRKLRELLIDEMGTQIVKAIESNVRE